MTPDMSGDDDRRDCVFCSIVAGRLPATVVGETDTMLAFRDINPAAPVHILLVPKRHVVDSAAQLTASHGAMLGELFELAAAVAELEHLDGTYRIVTNSGRGAGQTVFHLHLHLIGGWDREAALPEGLTLAGHDHEDEPTG